MSETNNFSQPRSGSPVGSIVANAGRAGFLAAAIMLAVQLIWRLNWSTNGVVQAFPEFLVAAIARLTPLSLFGAATENYGSWAKKSLFAGVLVGVLATGFRAGIVAGWLSRRIDRGAPGRLVAGALVSTMLFLITTVVVLPIAHLGVFATKSSYTSDILVQLILTFAIFAVAWTLLAAPRDDAIAMPDGEPLNRREAIGQLGWTAGTLAALATVSLSAWRLVSPRPPRVKAAETGESTVQDIVATQRAKQGYSEPSPTPEAQSSTADEVAELRSDLSLQTDQFAEFNTLESEGRLTPVLTTVDDFYHVSKNLSDPEVDETKWALTVTGLVDKELQLTYDDLVARATQTKITTLCCISNELNGDLIGTAQWQGFPLMDLLNEAGVKSGAIDIKLHAADDYEDSFPVARGMDPDTIVVTGMNGEPLRDDHGFPCRLIVPGIFGMKNVKWLDRIELVDENFMGYWQTRGWSDTAEAQIWGRIDYPGDGNKLETGQITAAGVASAGDRDIARGEGSLDNGQTWADATLEPSINPPFTWVRWAYTFSGTPGKYTMKIRATDGTGQVATEVGRPPLPDGATGWPRRKFEVKG